MDETERRFSMIHKALSAVYALLCSSGMDIRMQICTNTAGGITTDVAKRDLKFLKFERPPRDKFWERLRECHIFLSFSIEEGLPFALMEAIHLGTIGVVHRAAWSEDFLGKDYPWFATSVPQAFAHIKDIHNNKKKAWDKFLAWYESYFMKVIVPKGDSRTKFEEETQKWSAAVDKRTADIEVVDHIHKLKVKEIDLLSLPKGEVFRNVVNWRENDLRGVRYYRLPKRWILSYALRQSKKWKNTEVPWVLKRS
jgi:hypothetical protein